MKRLRGNRASFDPRETAALSNRDILQHTCSAVSMGMTSRAGGVGSGKAMRWAEAEGSLL